jgi:nucleoside-diphosphate-sugar epimerase
MRLLLAGFGYVGSALAPHLAAAGHTVTGLTRSESSAQSWLEQGQDVRAVDIADPAAICQLANEIGPMDFVIHCAASGRGGTEELYAAVYREGMRNLIAAFPSSRFLFTSSTSVYPQIDGSHITESSPAEPARGTGKILRETENLTLAAGGIVARLAGIYGPGRSVLLRQFLEGKSRIDVRTTPPETPDGRWINQVHLADIISALSHLVHLPAEQTSGQIFNVCDSRSLTQREVYLEMQRRFHKPLPEEAAPDETRKRGWSHKQVSNAKLRQTGWEPRYPDYFAALDHDRDFLPSILALVDSP